MPIPMMQLVNLSFSILTHSLPTIITISYYRCLPSSFSLKRTEKIKEMNFSFLNWLSQISWLPNPRWSLTGYAVSWTALLTLTVIMGSSAAELAFLYAMNPTPSSSPLCIREGSVKLPLDSPFQDFCFPVRHVKPSGPDMLVPPVFAAVMVAASACLVKALGLWVATDDDEVQQGL